MTGLHHALKQKCKNGFVRMSELKPNTKEIAKRMIADGDLWIDDNGFLRVAE